MCMKMDAWPNASLIWFSIGGHINNRTHKIAAFLRGDYEQQWRPHSLLFYSVIQTLRKYRI